MRPADGRRGEDWRRSLAGAAELAAPGPAMRLPPANHEGRRQLPSYPPAAGLRRDVGSEPSRSGTASGPPDIGHRRLAEAYTATAVGGYAASSSSLTNSRSTATNATAIASPVAHAADLAARTAPPADTRRMTSVRVEMEARDGRDGRRFLSARWGSMATSVGGSRYTPEHLKRVPAAEPASVEPPRLMSARRTRSRSHTPKAPPLGHVSGHGGSRLTRNERYTLDTAECWNVPEDHPNGP